MRNMGRRSLLVTALLSIAGCTDLAIAAQPTTGCAVPCYPTSTLMGLTASTNPTVTPLLPLAEATAPTNLEGNGIPLPEEEMPGSGVRALVKTHQRLQLDLAVNDRPRSPNSSTSPIISGYQKFVRDFWYHFWDPANAIPRIRPFTSLDFPRRGWIRRQRTEGSIRQILDDDGVREYPLLAMESLAG